MTMSQTQCAALGIVLKDSADKAEIIRRFFAESPEYCAGVYLHAGTRVPLSLRQFLAWLRGHPADYDDIAAAVGELSPSAVVTHMARVDPEMLVAVAGAASAVPAAVGASSQDPLSTLQTWMYEEWNALGGGGGPGGVNRVAFIKAVRTITALGLKEAKDLCDAVVVGMERGDPQLDRGALTKALVKMPVGVRDRLAGVAVSEAGTTTAPATRHRSLALVIGEMVDPVPAAPAESLVL